MTVYRQQLTTGGVIGATLAVLSPTIAFGVAAWSISGTIAATTDRYSFTSPDDFYVSPVIYIALVFLSTLGWVLLVVGREFTDAPRPTKVEGQANALEKDTAPSPTERHFGKPVSSADR